MARATFLALLGVTGLTTVLARSLLRSRPVLRWALAVAAMTGVLAVASLALHPAWTLRLDGIDPYVFLQRDLAVPFGVVFFTAVEGLVADLRSRRAVAIMPAVLGLYLLATGAWALGTPACYQRSDGRWLGGVCLQSTGYTCGAASVATLVAALGERPPTEHQAARLSFTVPDRGLTTLGASMALRTLLPRRRVRAQNLPVDALPRLRLPCLVALKYSFWFDHMVVVLRREGDHYVVGDPLHGPVRSTRAQLAARWVGDVVTVE